MRSCPGLKSLAGCIKTNGGVSRPETAFLNSGLFGMTKRLLPSRCHASSLFDAFLDFVFEQPVMPVLNQLRTRKMHKKMVSNMISKFDITSFISTGDVLTLSGCR